uniref:Uncharacterized protein n=1 Tax=Cacopsylla melanoneura TaxID=428564 RepID=A0A8D8WG83_9HEMI
MKDCLRHLILQISHLCFTLQDTRITILSFTSPVVSELSIRMFNPCTNTQLTLNTPQWLSLVFHGIRWDFTCLTYRFASSFKSCPEMSLFHLKWKCSLTPRKTSRPDSWKVKTPTPSTSWVNARRNSSTPSPP